uniref:Uncharacterized protein n=1 Tax=Arundo donax TaxID=35708 RepID=A0A0A9H420_ARUDO
MNAMAVKFLFPFIQIYFFVHCLWSLVHKQVIYTKLHLNLFTSL